MTPEPTSNSANILIVDDIPDNLRVLADTLTKQGYKVRSVVNGMMALRTAKASIPDIILLDIRMPDMDGYEVCQQLKTDPLTREIPIIFLSALDEALDKVKAFSVGGADYITKPFQFEEVLARIHHQLQLQSAKAEIRKLNAELEQRVVQRTAQLEKEITERQKVQEKLMHMALHDPLTDLPNRTWLMKRLDQLVHAVRQRPSYHFAVLFLDCDRFKLVNDSLGHLVGDQLLISLSRRLESSLNPSNTLTRFGGDEFVIILEDVVYVEEAIQVAQRIHRELSPAFHLDNHEIYTNVSIGIVLGDYSYDSPIALLRDADIALYQAKIQGRPRYQVFDRTMHEATVQRLQLETDLRRALEREELTPYYQPIVDLATGNIYGFEALVRWNHPEKGLIPPVDFIPIAEETGLILPIDLYILEKACKQIVEWQETLGLNLTISVNLSVQQFAQEDLLVKIDRILQETQCPSQLLKIEITEHALIDNDNTAHILLQALKQRQIQVSIDDFGTGYSSLSYLLKFPVDFLKVDRMFINQITYNSEHLAIVKTILELTEQLGMKVIAEGIETSEQLQTLRHLTCAFGQGYFFGKPLPVAQTTPLLKS